MEKQLNFVVLLGGIGALHHEWLFLAGRSDGRAGVADPIRCGMFRLALLGGPDALYRKKRVLRTTVTFFTNAALLSPQIAVNGIALRDFVVAETLGETHA